MLYEDNFSRIFSMFDKHLFIILLTFLIKNKKNNEQILKNNDKLKYIDSMT